MAQNLFGKTEDVTIEEKTENLNNIGPETKESEASTLNQNDEEIQIVPKDDQDTINATISLSETEIVVEENDVNEEYKHNDEEKEVIEEKPPLLWQAVTTEDGEVYYYNIETLESTWDDPYASTNDLNEPSSIEEREESDENISETKTTNITSSSSPSLEGDSVEDIEMQVEIEKEQKEEQEEVDIEQETYIEQEPGVEQTSEIKSQLESEQGGKEEENSALGTITPDEYITENDTQVENIHDSTEHSDINEQTPKTSSQQNDRLRTQREIFFEEKRRQQKEEEDQKRLELEKLSPEEREKKLKEEEDAKNHELKQLAHLKRINKTLVTGKGKQIVGKGSGGGIGRGMGGRGRGGRGK